MRRTALLALTAALVSTAALAADIAVKQEMKEVVDAASNILFAVGGTSIRPTGQTPPRSRPPAGPKD